MPPIFEIVLGFLEEYRSSILFFIFAFTAGVILLTELGYFYFLSKKGRLKASFFSDPKAPVGWALIPIMAILFCFLAVTLGTEREKQVRTFVGRNVVPVDFHPRIWALGESGTSNHLRVPLKKGQ